MQEAVLSCHHVGPRGQSQVIVKLGSKLLKPLSHFVDPARGLYTSGRWGSYHACRGCMLSCG